MQTVTIDSKWNGPKIYINSEHDAIHFCFAVEGITKALFCQNVLTRLVDILGTS